MAEILGVNKNAVPVTLGGEHTITYSLVKAINAVEPVRVVWLDAHADLKDDYLGQKWCHATVARRIRELGVEVTQAGVRSASLDEGEYAESDGVTQSSLNELMDLKGERVYVTVDLDVLDPGCAPGVGNPEPGGLSFNTLKNVITTLARENEVAGFDLVELVPVYDAGGVTAAAAAKLALEFMEKR